MWGTDWTRAVKFLIDAFRVTERISHSDKAKLMGGTLTRIYGWSPRQSLNRETDAIASLTPPWFGAPKTVVAFAP